MINCNPRPARPRRSDSLVRLERRTRRRRDDVVGRARALGRRRELEGGHVYLVRAHGGEEGAVRERWVSTPDGALDDGEDARGKTTRASSRRGKANEWRGNGDEQGQRLTKKMSPSRAQGVSCGKRTRLRNRLRRASATRGCVGATSRGRDHAVRWSDD